MAIIKKNELKQMNETQINERLITLKKEMMRNNAQIAVGTTPENPGRVKELKKTIARLLFMNSQIKNSNKKTKEEVKEKPKEKLKSKQKPKEVKEIKND